MESNTNEKIQLDELKQKSDTIQNLQDYLKNKRVTKYSNFTDHKWVFDIKPEKKSFSFKIHRKPVANENLELFWRLFIFYVTEGLPEISLRNQGKISYAYHSVVLFEFLQKINFPGEIPGTVLFTPEECKKFIDIIRKQKTSSTNKRKKLTIVQIWYQINNYLPSYFKLPVDPLQGKTLISIFPDNKLSSEEGWLPIPSDNALFLAKQAILWVENFGDEILDVHETWIRYTGSYPKEVEFKAFSRCYDNKGAKNTSVKIKLAEIVFQRLKKPSKEHPFYNIWSIATQLNNGEIGFTETRDKISRPEYNIVIRSLYGACVAIILFSTGMRKSELYSLQRGCLDTVSDTNIPLVENEVFKTDTGLTKIPISHIGAKAIRILERLGRIISEKNDGPLLVPVERVKHDANLNKLASLSTYATTMLQKFCDTIGYGKAPHLHQFRHTLAAAVWERTEQAPVLLKILYNHSSLSMTLHYLRRNPFIKYAKKELFKRKYLPLVQQVVQYQKNNQIAGPASKRVKKMAEYITNNDEFAGKTEKELTLALEELFMSMIEQDQMRLFLTPFCVCMRFNSSASKSPCMLIEDHSDTVLATLPRTDRCVGSVCQDSLFTPLHQDTLNESMNFYENYLDQIPEDMKGNVLIAKVAQKEIKKYQKISWSLNNA